MQLRASPLCSGQQVHKAPCLMQLLLLWLLRGQATAKEPVPCSVQEGVNLVQMHPGNVLFAGNGERLTRVRGDTGSGEAEHSLPETERSFAAKQRNEAWCQDTVGMCGMAIQSRLIYHNDVVEGTICLELMVPKSQRGEVLKLAHHSPYASHFCKKKTKECIKYSFFWLGVVPDVRQHCQTCHDCPCLFPKAHDGHKSNHATYDTGYTIQSGMPGLDRAVQARFSTG